MRNSRNWSTFQSTRCNCGLGRPRRVRSRRYDAAIREFGIGLSGSVGRHRRFRRVPYQLGGSLVALAGVAILSNTI